MSGCQDYLSALGDYLDDAVTGDTRADIERHLDCCIRCRIVYSTTRCTVELYKKNSACELSVEIESRLFAALETRFGWKCSDRSKTSLA